MLRDTYAHETSRSFTIIVECPTLPFGESRCGFMLSSLACEHTCVLPLFVDIHNFSREGKREAFWTLSPDPRLVIQPSCVALLLQVALPYACLKNHPYIRNHTYISVEFRNVG